MDRTRYYICIDGKRISLLPTSEEEYKELVNAIVNVLGVTALNSTNNGNFDDKQRVEAIMSFCGNISADGAKWAIQLYAKDHPKVKLNNDGGAKEEPAPKDPGRVGDA